MGWKTWDINQVIDHTSKYEVDCQNYFLSLTFWFLDVTPNRIFSSTSKSVTSSPGTNLNHDKFLSRPLQNRLTSPDESMVAILPFSCFVPSAHRPQSILWINSSVGSSKHCIVYSNMDLLLWCSVRPRRNFWIKKCVAKFQKYLSLTKCAQSKCIYEFGVPLFVTKFFNMGKNASLHRDREVHGPRHGQGRAENISISPWRNIKMREINLLLYVRFKQCRCPWFVIFGRVGLIQFRLFICINWTYIFID